MKCGPATGASSSRGSAAALDAGDTLVVIGAGGLGLSAIRLARSVHGIAPVVAEIDRTKWDAALAAGAAQVLDPRDGEAVKRLIARTGGAAAVVDFVGA